ncbi:MAG: MerR family transcriptional regulator [Actinobacteria bacterium]|nr:MerR family transcriptional regulator [Actinomycetota bacterium]
MQIGELAERTGLSHRTIRHYDDVGILRPAERTDGGYRVYTDADEARLLLIRRMKPLGYSLEQMKALLDVVEALAIDPADAATRAHLDRIRVEAVARRDTLANQLAAADEFVARLTIG